MSASSLARCDGLPSFAERPNLHIERPCRTRLVSDVPDFGGNIVRLYEEGIRPLRPALARPRNIDDGVDREVGGMHALRAKVPGDGFEQDALCRLCGGKSGKAGLPRQADVFPLAIMAPSPADTMSSVTFRAR